MSKAVVFFAEGTEECEALLVVDLLRRAKVEVTVASASGSREIVSSHKVHITADALAEEVDYSDVDMVVLPGGTPAGVGMGMDPPQFLKPGDTVRCEIDGIGSLTNTVR